MNLAHTPLHALHQKLGAKMMAFAGYDMPVNYPGGIVQEHHACRSSVVLFDVSHMGQISVQGPRVAQTLEALLPLDLLGMATGQQRYGFFTAPTGGILDDLMITKRERDWLLIVNAACKDQDLAHLQSHLGADGNVVQPLQGQALLALQGPKAADVLRQFHPDIAHLAFMTGRALTLAGMPCYVTRSGYTGEDGFEISLPSAHAEALAQQLLRRQVVMAGLGARDTLRLEAGLCLYGQDICATTSPLQAQLSWAIAGARRPGGARPGAYLGAQIIDAQRTQTLAQKRVGLMGQERTPVRAGTVLTNAQGEPIGTITSGTFSLTLQRPIAMGYLNPSYTQVGQAVQAKIRGKDLTMHVSALPFVPHRYHR